MSKQLDNFQGSIGDMDRHLKERISEDEKKLMQNWLKNRHGHDKHDDVMDEKRLKAIGDEIYNKIDAEIGLNSSVRWKSKWLFFRVAASIALCMLLGLGFYLFEKSEDRFTLIENPSGRVKQVILADGTKVWLNGNAKFKVQEEFDGAFREVFLQEGEAFFNVQRNENQPFIVHVAGLEVKVLGTSFNIKTYPDLSDTRITVASGIVTVDNEDKTLNILRKDDELVFNKKASSFYMRKSESKKIAGWRKGNIYLQDVPFQEFVIALKSRYGVRVKYPQKLDKQKISIHLFNNQSIGDVFEIIKNIYGITYKIEGKEVEISFSNT